jgi:hypothetical protein
MKISELLDSVDPAPKGSTYSIIDGFEIYASGEEVEILKKLSKPVKLASLSEHDQFRIQAMIRKSLVTKVGMENPTVVANEKIKQN